MSTHTVFSGRRLRLFRELRGLSPRQLSDALRAQCRCIIARTTIGCYERGLTEPRATALAAMAAVLEVDMTELFDRQPPA